MTVEPAASGPFARPEELLAHAEWLRRLARSLVGESEADDLVQDTWVAALRRPPRSAGSPQPWLARVLSNVASNTRRGQRRRVEHEVRASAGAAEPPADPGRIAAELEAQRRLLEAVAQLDEPLRTTVVLRYFRGQDSETIARAEHVPAGTVRWRLKRALELLRERLDASFGDRGTWMALFLPYALPTGTFVAPPASTGAETAALMQGVVVMQALKVGVAVSLACVCGLALWQLRGGAEQEPAAVVAARGGDEVEPRAENTQPKAPLEVPVAAPERAAVAPVAPPEPAEAAPAAAEKLAKPAMVHARFVDESSLPVAGVRLYLHERDDPPQTSDADGRVVLPAAPPYPQLLTWYQKLRAERSGFATVMLGSTLNAGLDTHLGDVVLLPGSVVNGRVTTADGRAVAGAVVRTSSEPAPAFEYETRRQERYGPDEYDGPRAVTNEDGSYALAGVAPGKRNLWAQADGMRFTQRAALEVQLGADLYGIDLVLEPWRRADHIRGRVVGPAGEPVKNAGVAYDMEAEGIGLSSALQAGEDGRFELLVPYDGVYRFTASDPEQRWAEAIAAGVECGAEIEIALTEKRWIEIVATDPEGQPVEHFGVTIENTERTTTNTLTPAPHPGGVQRVAVPAEAFDVTLEALGFALETQGPFEPSTAPEKLAFELERAPLLRGRVLAGGEPIAGARVELRESQANKHVVCEGFRMVMQRWSRTTATTDAEGRFELSLSRSGDFYVHASAEGWVATFVGPLALEAGVAPAPVELSLARGGELAGRVLVAPGRDAAGIVVGVSCGDGHPRTQRTGPGGTFRFEGLTPAMWQVVRCEAEINPSSTTTTYSGREAEPIRWDCQVFDGKTTFFDLDLTKDG